MGHANSAEFKWREIATGGWCVCDTIQYEHGIFGTGNGTVHLRTFRGSITLFRSYCNNAEPITWIGAVTAYSVGYSIKKGKDDSYDGVSAVETQSVCGEKGLAAT